MMFAVLMPFSDLWPGCGGATTALAQKAVVRTESGQVKGIDQEGSTAFLGIPYAKVERFMPPQPVDKWEGIRVCDHWGPQAMQNTWGRKLSEAEMSEQCCVLNVWRPSLTPPVKGEKTPPLNRGGREGSHNCPDSNISTIRSVNLSVPSGSYSFFRLAPKAQAKACQKPARSGPMNAWMAS